MCMFKDGLSASCCMSDVRYLVSVMCGTESVLCADFSLCHVRFAATSLVASLRACLASLGRDDPNKGPMEGSHLCLYVYVYTCTKMKV